MSESVDGFAGLGLDPRLTAALAYAAPTSIQREAIPALLAGRDLVGLAGTGTGKTAAFALPLVHRLAAGPAVGPGPAALVLVPTRELAVQVSKAVSAYGRPAGTRVLAVYGGTAYADQARTLRRGVDVVVATPGRALDLVRQGRLDLAGVAAVVLDEADEMLEMGFAQDIDALLAATPGDRQTMLFSATMPPWIEAIAGRHLRDPARVRVAAEKPSDEKPAAVRQTAYVVRAEHKVAALGRILEVERAESAIVFCRTREAADELTEALGRRGFRPLALHGGMSQDQRDRCMTRFRAGAADLLVATDVAARGLDIPHLSHVVNFDLPDQPDAYAHRTGRVGRAGRAGVAITLVTPRERAGLGPIERATGRRVVIAPLPSAADLQAARLGRVRRALREELARPASDVVAGLVAELETEFPAADVARAAARLLVRPPTAEDEADIPAPPEDRCPARRPEAGPDGRRRVGARPTRAGMAKVFFGIGRDARVTPKDLVGAICNEAGIPGRDLGAIDLTDRFALVEVPADLAGYVVEAMQGARIRGRSVHVRPDRPPRPH
jgi:ATP-dependent RNA helicase DeaD